jgi:hypothetical protein
MMKWWLKYIGILIVFLISGISYAQELSVSSRLDTNIILIGDQVKLSLEINKPTNLQVDFPFLSDTVMENIEILDESPIDTVSSSGTQTVLKKEYVLTSFDSSIYMLPSFPFVYHLDTLKDTVWTNPLILGVQTMQVDTTQMAIYDIKDPYESPWSLIEFLNTYFWHAFIISSIIAFVVLIIFVIVPLLLRKKIKDPIIASKPLEPAHVIALRELDHLKEEKLWQNNKIKQYHSRLSEIIRTYMEHRFEIMAMEQTSFEILDAYSKQGKVETKNYETLQQILTLADFVKFAKYSPLPNENDLSMKNAYYFVNETKVVLNQQNTESDNIEEEQKDV